MRQTKEVSRVISEKDIDIYIESHTNMLKLAEYVKQNPSCSDAACLLQHSILAHTRNLSPWKLLFSPSAFKEIIQKYPIIDNYCRREIDKLIGPNYQTLQFNSYCDDLRVYVYRHIEFDSAKNTIVRTYKLNCEIVYYLSDSMDKSVTNANSMVLVILCSKELYDQISLDKNNQLPQSLVDDCLLLLLNYCETEMAK